MREMCLEYAFWPGQQLQIDELAVPLGLSATPVREALARLAGEGLVRVIPNRGYFANSITLNEMESKLEFMFVLLSTIIERAELPFECPRPWVDQYKNKDCELYMEVVRGIAEIARNAAISEQIGLLFERTRHVRRLILRKSDAEASTMASLNRLTRALDDGCNNNALAAIGDLHGCLLKHLPVAIHEAQSRIMSREPWYPHPAKDFVNFRGGAPVQAV